MRLSQLRDHWLWIVVSLLLFLLYFSESASASTSTLKKLEAASQQQFLVQLTVNGQRIKSDQLVLRNAQGNWLLPLAELEFLRVRVPKAAVLVIDAQRWLPLTALPDASATFDETNQSLDVRLSPTTFAGTQTSIRELASATQVGPTATGLFLNYDLSLQAGDTGEGHSVFLEAGASLSQGVAIGNFAWIRQSGLNLVLRLDTSFTTDHPQDMATLKLGDTITRPGTILGRAVRFGGIQYATNFLTQPGLVTVPMATLGGQAALPSTVDVYVNNTLQGRKELQPGPFSISGVPLISGDGQVRMVVTDLAGNQQVITQSFYTSPILLASGLGEFSFESGALRKNFGIASNDYGKLFTAASYRRGMTDSFTLEGALQIEEGRAAGVQTAATFLLPGFGVGTFGIAGSHEKGASGAQVATGIERRTFDWNIGARSQYATRDYHQLGVDPQFTTLRLDSANFGWRVGEWGRFGLTVARQQLATGEPMRVLTASFSTTPKSWGSLTFSALQTRSNNGNGSNGGDSVNNAVGVFWNMPFDGNLNASASFNHASTGPDQTVLQVQRNLPTGTGYGYRLQAGENAPQQASLLLQNEVGQARIEAAEFRGFNSARIGWSGGIAAFDGRWFASRRITDSYGLVRLPEMENVRIYVDNQFVATTNAHGEAFLPRLQSWLPNRVSLEQIDLGMDTEIDSLLMRPVPAWRSGVLVEFPVRRAMAATLTVRDEQGVVLPAGSMASIAGQSDSFPLGRDGLLYLTGLQAKNSVTVERRGKRCSFRFTYQPVAGSVPELGEFTCRSLPP